MDPRVGIDSLEYAMAHAMEGAPGGPKPWLTDLGYGAHRAYFLLPCIEQAKSTSGTLFVMNMFM